MVCQTDGNYDKSKTNLGKFFSRYSMINDIRRLSPSNNDPIKKKKEAMVFSR
jgi:hypothetical protein